MLQNALATSPARPGLAARARLLPSRHARAVRGSRVAVGVGCVEFLWLYAGLHLAHVQGFDLAVARAVSPIPLFAIFIVSVALAGLLAVPTTMIVRASRRPLTSLSSVLAASIMVFAASVILFP
jgi:hypothetical protein